MTALAGDLAASLDPVAFALRTGFDPERWQADLLRSPARRALALCARQVGKTTTTGIRVVHRSIFRPGSLSVIISPTQRQSNEMLLGVKGRFRAAANAPRFVRDSDTELALENGSRVLSLPGTEGTTRGYANVKLLVIDEAAKVDDEIFYAVLPMVASDGVIMALSTPAGQRGWFYDLHQDPMNGWERHKITVHESRQWDARRIAESRASMASFAFAADCECVFGDTDEQMFPTELVRRMVTPDVEPLEW